MDVSLRNITVVRVDTNDISVDSVGLEVLDNNVTGPLVVGAVSARSVNG